MQCEFISSSAMGLQSCFSLIVLQVPPTQIFNNSSKLNAGTLFEHYGIVRTNLRSKHWKLEDKPLLFTSKGCLVILFALALSWRKFAVLHSVDGILIIVNN